MNIKLIWNKFTDFLKKYQFTTVMQFAFLNGLIWMLMSVAYLHFVNINNPSLNGKLYSFIFTIGHLGTFSCGLWIILQLLRFIGEKTFKISALSLATLLIFILFADIVVYAQYRFHINIPMIGLFCSPAAFELVSFPLVMILSLIVLIAAIIAGEFGLFKLSQKIYFPKSCIAWFVIIGLSFLSFNAIHAWCAFHGNREILIRTDALPLKYAMTATRKLMRMGYKPAQKIQSSVAGEIMKYPLNKLHFQPPQKPKNVIFILVDSMRGDMFNPDVMPRLWDMTEKFPSAKFMQHFSGGNCTKTGVFSLFYGIPGFYFDQALRSGSGAAMIDAFIENNYEMKIFSSGTLASPPFNRTIFVNVENLAQHTKGATKLDRDKSCFANLSDFLKNRNSEKPYFAFLFLDGLHGNSIDDDFQRKFGSTLKKVNYLNITNDEETKQTLLNFTKDATYYMDYALHKFIEDNDLKKAITEDTILIITADHGNEYGESQMQNWGHNSNFARYQTHVPLIIFGLNEDRKKVDYRTSYADVSTTIMQDILGCTNDTSDYSIGKNLFDSSERPFIISSSYLETALIYQNKVFAMTVYGVMQQYDLDGKFIESSIPPEGMKYLLKIMAQYAK